ncbi:hypothetical protein N7520_000742 [Penicillium odoratum]|uniref:uncharacterized protein n=1 Tax=Penicillium odoratum TaxID=1167516 RepID=UPI0025480D42|nr:uncharacterized protein N7520_000742 [Penicillium odoratum]KAJ5777496.1 hypothetical protein N7520_000742 [Penicillium odoratum]
MGGSSTPQEAAPAYEELFEQRPSNPVTGYSHIPVADELDVENRGHEHAHHLDTDTPVIHLAAQNEEQVHFHCEECDRRQERRERRRSNQNCCMMVSATFVIIIFLLCVFGFKLAAELHKGGKRDPRDVHIFSA